MDAITLHRRAVQEWQRRLDAVESGQWDHPTPCSEWDVRALVNHVVGEQRWVPPLLEGQTIEEVGDRFDGDLLGDDPVATGREAATEALSAVDEHAHRGVLVHLSFGDSPVEEYLLQLAADHLIHGWDLAAATGQDRTLDPDLVSRVATWFVDQEEGYRAGGAVAERAGTSDDPQIDLLAGFGRRADWQP